MNLVKKNWLGLLFILFLLIIPTFSFAQPTVVDVDPCLPGSGKICNPISQNTITGFVQTLLEGVLRIGIPVVALAIIYCGFLFVAARGNSEKLSQAKNALLYTLIGAAILLGSWAIAILISETVRAL